MDHFEEVGIELVAKAKRKLEPPITDGIFCCGKTVRSNKRIREAYDLYHQAANAFKIANKWRAAANAYCEAAKLMLMLEEPSNAVKDYISAGICHKKTVHHQDAITCLKKAVHYYAGIEVGEFYTAAEYLEEIAELYEKFDMNKAIECYEQAVDYYYIAESEKSGRCLLKVAEKTSLMGYYEKAITIFEKLAFTVLETSSLQHSADDCFFRSVLTHLCIGVENAQKAVEKYVLRSTSFSESPQLQVLLILIEHVENGNIEGVNYVEKEYAHHLDDKWFAAIFILIKKILFQNLDIPETPTIPEYPTIPEIPTIPENPTTPEIPETPTTPENPTTFESQYS